MFSQIYVVLIAYIEDSLLFELHGQYILDTDTVASC